MLLKNALQRLEKKGFSIKSNLGSYVATLNGTTISFFAQNDKCSKFTYESENSCASTYGLTLKQALEFS